MLKVNFSSIDGVLYNKGLSSIICYPSGKTNEQFIILDSVKQICDNSFVGVNFKNIISYAFVAPAIHQESCLQVTGTGLSVPSGAIRYEQGFWTNLNLTFRGNYTVTFYSQGGNNIDAITGLNTNIVPPTISPVKEGFYFDGWYLDSEYISPCLFSCFRVSNDVDLYAKWSISPPSISYATVTFDSNGSASTATTPYISLTLPSESHLAFLPSAKWKYPSDICGFGYSFVEWNTKKDGTGEKFTTNTFVEKDITVYAIWKSKNPPAFELPKNFEIYKVTEDIQEKTVTANLSNSLGVNFENITAICAIYMQDGRITEIKKTTIPALSNNDSCKITFNFNSSIDFTNYKIYIWNGLSKFVPICSFYSSQ